MHHQRADKGRARPPAPNTNWDRVSVADLLSNVARHWRLSPKECNECYGALYTHITAKAQWISYKRCPSCRMNFIDAGATNFTDKAGDAMLDAAARRTPLIGHPYQAHDNPENEA